METAAWASSRASAGNRVRASRVGATLSLAASIAAILSAVATEITWWPAPLWAIARRKRPSAHGIESRLATLMAPADSPKIVTLSGSPPNEAMDSRTHSSAATWSSSPRLAGAPATWAKPSTPRR